MDRITPEDIQKALDAHPELRLDTTRMLFPKEDYIQCCGIGAVYYERCRGADKWPEDVERDIWDASREDLGNDYQAGFWQGFDGAYPDFDEGSTRFQQGLADGEACRNHFGIA